jgi:hypothetical protein
MSDDARRSLAEQQKALVNALTGGAAAPDGFDHDQIETTATALAAKRLRTAQKAWPALAEALAERFEPLFRRYASEKPLADEGPHADARAFLSFVLEQEQLSDAERLRLVPLRVRSGFPIRYFIGSDGFAIAVRLWGSRVRAWGSRT